MNKTILCESLNRTFYGIETSWQREKYLRFEGLNRTFYGIETFKSKAVGAVL